MSRLFKNATLFYQDKFINTDFMIDDKGILVIADLIDIDDFDEVIDCSGIHVFPGFVDPHVHLRQPGFEYKETIKTGTLAAAKGGYTTIFAMPNLKPACDSLEHLKMEMDIIDRDACINVYPICAITKGQTGKGELVDFDSLKDECFLYSDDGKGVQSEDNMRKAMEIVAKNNGVIIAHCEDENELCGGSLNKGKISEKFNDAGINNASEYNEVIRDLRLAKETGCQFHICHISCKESVDALRKAKESNPNVSGEVTVHHLLLNEEDIDCDNGKWKMNPPLRSKEDQKALIEAIQDKTIEVICTDNAPHSEAEKNCPIAKASFGIVENEIAFSLIYTKLVKNKIISLEDAIKLMSTNACDIFGIDGGRIENLEVANLCFYDLNANQRVDAKKFISMGKSCPFDKMILNSKCVMTICNGDIVYREGI